jgi:hypothetical protein
MGEVPLSNGFFFSRPSAPRPMPSLSRHAHPAKEHASNSSGATKLPNVGVLHYIGFPTELPARKHQVHGGRPSDSSRLDPLQGCLT